jgi:hypothetical protein
MSELESEHFMLTSYRNSGVYVGPALGELRLAYHDGGANNEGKIRLTAKTPGMVSDDSYLHVSAAYDITSSERRYPQLILSSAPYPVQEGMNDAVSFVIDTKQYAPNYLQVQLCQARTWAPNNLCPFLPTFDEKYLPAAPIPSDLNGMDRTVRVDVWISTRRLYISLDDRPYACTGLPARSVTDEKVYPGLPSGPVSVTFGDVLYHSGIDLTVSGGAIPFADSFAFLLQNQLVYTQRHLDYFGFVSGVSGPASWDESLFPCIDNLL